MEYICLINPLETHQLSPESSPTIRNRNITAVEKIKNNFKEASEQKVVTHHRRNRVDLRSKELKRSIEFE